MFAKIASHAVILLLAACAGREPSFPAEAAGRYQLDYSGVYGVGRVALLLLDGQVRGLGAGAGGITYQGFYRWAPDGRLVEFVELDGHPFWIGTQAHPEFKSRPNKPAPLFREFARAALDRAEGRNPHLIQLEADPATSRT